MRLGIVIALTIAACTKGEDPVDCAAEADFAACEIWDGTDGTCLLGTCTPVPACDGCDPAATFKGVTFPIPDTLVEACYGPAESGQDGTIACPGTAGAPTCADTALCGQDAQYGWDTAHPRSDRFVVDNAGAERIVTDQVTGLVWQGCARGQGDDCAGEALRGSWYEADAFCSDSTWGGHDDWELPVAAALQSTVDYGTTSPAIDTTVFRNAPSRFAIDSDEWWIECMWSATDSASSADVAWGLMVNSGDVLSGSGVPFHAHDKAADGWVGCYTRCVRAQPAPTHVRHLELESAGEGLVADLIARRMWPRCSLGQTGPGCTGAATMMPWSDALGRCEALEWGGYDDWRLPNVIELRSLVDLGRFRPAIDGDLFPNTPYYDGDNDLEGQYWSSTARWYNGFALYVSFHDGGSHFYVQDEERHVRCIRG